MSKTLPVSDSKVIWTVHIAGKDYDVKLKTKENETVRTTQEIAKQLVRNYQELVEKIVKTGINKDGFKIQTKGSILDANIHVNTAPKIIKLTQLILGVKQHKTPFSDSSSDSLFSVSSDEAFETVDLGKKSQSQGGIETSVKKKKKPFSEKDTFNLSDSDKETIIHPLQSDDSSSKGSDIEKEAELSDSEEDATSKKTIIENTFKPKRFPTQQEYEAYIIQKAKELASKDRAELKTGVQSLTRDFNSLQENDAFERIKLENYSAILDLDLVETPVEAIKELISVYRAAIALKDKGIIPNHQSLFDGLDRL
jgi:hypothetical protein